VKVAAAGVKSTSGGLKSAAGKARDLRHMICGNQGWAYVNGGFLWVKLKLCTVHKKHLVTFAL
jgi:hypothetical protein